MARSDWKSNLKGALLRLSSSGRDKCRRRLRKVIWCENLCQTKPRRIRWLKTTVQRICLLCISVYVSQTHFVPIFNFKYILNTVFRPNWAVITFLNKSCLITFGTSTWERVTRPDTRSTLWGLLLLVTSTRDTPASSSASWGEHITNKYSARMRGNSSIKYEEKDKRHSVFLWYTLKKKYLSKNQSMNTLVSCKVYHVQLHDALKALKTALYTHTTSKRNCTLIESISGESHRVTLT